MCDFIVNDQNPKSKFRKLLDAIPVGMENAITSRELSHVLRMDPRDIRAMITRARTEGNIIAGTTVGYFIPANKKELEGYKRYIDAKHRTGYIALNAVRKELKEGSKTSEQ